MIGPLALHPFLPYLVLVPECSPLLDTPLALYPNPSPSCSPLGLCILAPPTLLPWVLVPLVPSPFSPPTPPIFNRWTLCNLGSLSLDPFVFRINLVHGILYKEPLRLLCLRYCLLIACVCTHPPQVWRAVTRAIRALPYADSGIGCTASASDSRAWAWQGYVLRYKPWGTVHLSQPVPFHCPKLGKSRRALYQEP